MLTDDQITYVATRAHWYFDCLYPQTGADGDWTVFTGEGLADINLMINRYQAQPDLRVRLDVGQLTPSYQDVTLEEVQAVRTAFVSIHGSVNSVSRHNPSLATPIIPISGTAGLEVDNPPVAV